MISAIGGAAMSDNWEKLAQLAQEVDWRAAVPNGTLEFITTSETRAPVIRKVADVIVETTSHGVSTLEVRFDDGERIVAQYRFCGPVKDLDSLPSDAQVGDSYYVEKAEALVVHGLSGWHHFDRSET